MKGSGNEPHHQGKLRIDEITRIRTWEGDTWISFDPEPDFYILLSDRYEAQLEEAGPEYTCVEMNGRNDKAVPPRASYET